MYIYAYKLQQFKKFNIPHLNLLLTNLEKAKIV